MSDWSKLTVVKLKEELKRRGLATTGLKAALVARLEEDDAAPEESEEPEEPAIAQEDGAPQEQQEDEAPEASLTATDAPVADVAEPAQSPGIPAIESAQGEREERDELPVAEPESAPEPVLEPAPEPVPEPVAESVPEPAAIAEVELESTPSPTAEAEPVPADDVQMEEAANPTEAESTQQLQEEVLRTRKASDSSVTPEVSELNRDHDMEEAGHLPAPDVERREDARDERLKGSQALGTPISERASQAPESMKAVETVYPATQTSVGLEEMVEDKRKRKRRSQSPQPSTQDAAFKKLKGQDGSPKAQLPKDDAEASTHNDEPKSNAPMTDALPVPEPEPSPAKPSTGDARFKNLFAAPTAAPQQDQPADALLEDRNVAPAVHPATAALYIRNLQRPLQPNVIREHLASLSQPPTSTSTDDAIVDFFLDQIRSHCFVQFTSTSAASRVRLALHDTVWPKERDRRPLWIDYIPEEKVKKFTDAEQAVGPRPAKRWEVVYEDEDGTVMAKLREADPNAQRRQMAQGFNGAPTPTTTKPVVPAVPKGDPGRGFKALDDLFMSTNAKPKLYFQPVPDSVVNRRLDLLEEGRGGGRGDEMRRFSFEDDIIVDKGPEWGFQSRGPPERRGRGGYRGGFGGRGGYRGDSWRGGR